jgi:hypothetical protein
MGIQFFVYVLEKIATLSSHWDSGKCAESAAARLRCLHASRDMAKGTLRNILAIIGMDAEEFRKLL